MAVLGKIEFAGTARNRAAVLDRIQELAFLDRLQEPGADVTDFLAACDQIANQCGETGIIDTRLALEALQGVELMVKLLQNLAADIASRENRQAAL